MKNNQISTAIFLLLLMSMAGLSCQKNEIYPEKNQDRLRMNKIDIGLEELLAGADVVVNVRQNRRAIYQAIARGRGTVPSGEYAGRRFMVQLEATYSDLGMETLISGSASVRIGSENFVSVTSPDFGILQSFCCGEGHLMMIDGEWVFTVYGQVRHTTATIPHQHLFAGLASTDNTMNMNIEDQTGTVVDPVDPSHDPGIGLIVGFPAHPVRVR